VTDPSELEAARARIEKLEAENDRLRKRLGADAPSHAPGRTFFAFAMLAFALSLAFGMFLAHVLRAPPLDRDTVARALAAVRIDDCGADLEGRVYVTFAPSGHATAARVDPPLAGTAPGACVEDHFRSARIPAFSGGPQTFGEAFGPPIAPAKSP
jgi:hypothetical protein